MPHGRLPAREAAMQTPDYQRLDRAHHLHPFTDFKALGEEGSRIIERADGVYPGSFINHLSDP